MKIDNSSAIPQDDSEASVIRSCEFRYIVLSKRIFASRSHWLSSWRKRSRHFMVVWLLIRPIMEKLWTNGISIDLRLCLVMLMTFFSEVFATKTSDFSRRPFCWTWKRTPDVCKKKFLVPFYQLFQLRVKTKLWNMYCRNRNPWACTCFRIQARLFKNGGVQQRVECLRLMMLVYKGVFQRCLLAGWARVVWEPTTGSFPSIVLRTRSHV